MRKALIAMMVAIAMTSSAKAAQIEWGNDPEIFDWSGAANLVLESYTSYSIRLYKSTDANINFGLVGGVATPTGDDTWTGISFNWNSAGADGFASAIIPSSDTTWGVNAGNKIYSVIFNNTPNSGYFAIIDSVLATVSYPGDAMTYNPGGVNGGLQSAGGDWQAIPEPATFALFGMGGIGAWLIRRKNRMSK